MDDTDPMVSVMKLEKAPQESYADIGGLDQQIQEIKVDDHDKNVAVTTFCSMSLYLYVLSTVFLSLPVTVRNRLSFL